MCIDSGVGIDYGSEWHAGWSVAKRENWDNCNRINNKIVFKNTDFSK